MKQIIIFIVFICFPMLATAQSEVAKPYIYNILTFSGSLRKEGFKVDVDNGKEIEKLKDANGKTIKFKTPAAALMYFISQGWELYVNGATSEGAMVNGIGASETTSYWIIRKPCTQEEFNKTVEEGIRK